ncbi:hypothetical protein GCM10010182_82420 [Actinomadura cremea]|nr:hypothetical protein GCM10010182_82420 [Actinomadura cremea]
MLSIAEPVDAVRARIASFGGRLSVAAVNGPSATVVSGDADALQELAESCGESPRTRMIPVDYASHSAYVDELRDEIVSVLEGIEPGEARVPMVSAMSGEWLNGPELTPEYWYASLRETVEFDRAIRVLGESGHGVFVESSPHPVLTPAIAESLEDRTPVVVDTLRRDDGGADRLLASLAMAHVQGVSIDWGAVLGRGATVDLPTYAFRRDRFWPEPQEPSAGRGPVTASTPAEAGFWNAVETGDTAALAELLGVDASDTALGALAEWRRRERAESAIADWRYRIAWKTLAADGAAPTGTWLLIGDAPGVADALAAAGARVLPVEVDGIDTTDKDALAAALPGDVADLSGIVSALALDADADADAPLDSHPGVPRGLAATLALAQAVTERPHGTNTPAPPLWVLTRGAVVAPGDETAGTPVQAQIWALGRSVALAHPQSWGGLVDLPERIEGPVAGRLAAVLADGREDQVALRRSGAYGRRLARAPRPSAPAPETAWAPRGTVLVTGGTGALGEHVGRWLADRGACRVVLTGRRGPATEGVPARAAELAAAGVRVDVVACDVAERPAVAGLLKHIDATGGPALSTVMHTAGVGQGRTVADTTAADLAEVCAPKADGARWLDELTADRDLDAFVLFSSGAAVWGGSEQTGYAAANGFLDGLAAARRAAGRPATTLAWGRWEGGGMAGGDIGTRLNRYGLRAMDPALAVQALGQALDAGEDSLTVADIDWSVFAPTYTLRRPSPLLADLPEAGDDAAAADAPLEAAAPAPGGLAETLAGLPRAERLRRLADLVCEQAAAVLGHSSGDALPKGRPFRKLGFDSIMAIDLRNRMTGATGLKLPATLVFDHPTPAELAEYLDGELVPEGAAHDPNGTGGDPVLDGLDRLEAALTAVAGGSGARRDVTARLRTMLSRWLGDTGQPPPDEQERQTVDGRLESADAGEVLDFINKELGL